MSLSMKYGYGKTTFYPNKNKNNFSYDDFDPKRLVFEDKLRLCATKTGYFCFVRYKFDAAKEDTIIMINTPTLFTPTGPTKMPNSDDMSILLSMGTNYEFNEHVMKFMNIIKQIEDAAVDHISSHNMIPGYDRDDIDMMMNRTIVSSTKKDDPTISYPPAFGGAILSRGDTQTKFLNTKGDFLNIAEVEKQCKITSVIMVRWIFLNKMNMRNKNVKFPFQITIKLAIAQAVIEDGGYYGLPKADEIIVVRDNEDESVRQVEEEKEEEEQKKEEDQQVIDDLVYVSIPSPPLPKKQKLDK